MDWLDREDAEELEAEVVGERRVSLGDGRDIGDVSLDLVFSGEVVQWRGPAPYYFVRMPEEASSAVRAIASIVSYGWGCISVQGRIGETEFTTALIPKNGVYLVPLKDAVRRPTEISEGDEVEVHLTVGT
ncbi:MAG TPA: DUF1905 domain-containing protein [Candidatus Binatia bacterium]|nr:DUF1905 domain-containing protein [Candidatus Binatia bacterium]